MAKMPSIDEMAKTIAEKALDEYEYEGKTLRQWIAIIQEQEGQPKHTKEEWEKAVENIKWLRNEAQLIPTGMFYVAECNRMLREYEQGNRTDELFEEMNNAH